MAASVLHLVAAVAVVTGNMAEELESSWRRVPLQDVEFLAQAQEVTAKSPMQCAAQCARQDGCLSFTLRPSDAICRLHSIVATASSTYSAKTGVHLYWKLRDVCPSTYSLLGGSRLCLRHGGADRLRREAAAAVCEREGAHLITMATKEQQAELWDWLQSRWPGGRSGTYWSGTKEVSGTFLQPDGYQATFWTPGQPDGQTCTVIYNVSNHDNLCDVDNNYICQIPMT